MENSYAQHAADTLEYQQGRNSAEINAAVAYGSPIQNPYPPSSKEWLDWQIGYESWNGEVKTEETIPVYFPMTFDYPFLF